jgi:hypothetical protein
VLKVNNLKRLFKQLGDYIDAHLGRALTPDAVPNWSRLTREMDEQEVVKLARLVVYAAVQSPTPRQSEYVQMIQQCSQDAQLDIMMAIQEVHRVQLGVDGS